MAKCIRCGAKIQEGTFECSVCGAGLQLVPDYVSLDLDLMIHQSATAEKKIGELETRRNERRSQIEKLKFIKRICIVAIVAATAIGVGVAAMSIGATMSSTADDFDSAYNDALEMYEAGEYQDAYNAINTALEYDEENIDALVLKARISYFGLENLDEAESILRSIITDDNEEERAYEALIEIYVDAEQYDSLAYVMDTAASSIQATFAEYIVDVPEFSVEEGTYNVSKTLVLSSSEGCDIYYTTDSDAEFEDYVLYSEPLELEDGSTAITAIAVSDSGLRSVTQTMTYNIVLDIPDTPVIMTASGSYSGSNNTVIIGDVEGATVYYAIDERPTEQSEVYTGPIAMQAGRHFVYAIAISDQGVESSISAIWYQYTAVTGTTSGSSSSSTTQSNEESATTTTTTEETDETDDTDDADADITDNTDLGEIPEDDVTSEGTGNTDDAQGSGDGTGTSDVTGDATENTGTGNTDNTQGSGDNTGTSDVTGTGTGGTTDPVADTNN